MTTNIYLIRHGQSTWNAERRVCGQTDVPLSPRGHQQGRMLAAALSGVRLSAIYTSPLRRSIETARPVARAHRVAPTALPALSEMNYGQLEGRRRDDSDAEARDLWQAFKRDPHGQPLSGAEPYAQFMRRVTACVETLLQMHRGQSVLIVGHRAVNRVILGTLLHLPTARWQALQPRSSILYRIALAAAPSLEVIALSDFESGPLPDRVISA